MLFSRFLPLSLIFTALIHTPSNAQTFEIVDGSASISGQPSSLSGDARKNWQAACAQWKGETKDLNKDNQILVLSCETPLCTGTGNDTGSGPETDTAGTFSCTSTGLVKLKTSGTLAAQPAPVYPSPVVAASPPLVIVESGPAPRPAYIWVGGYWGWRENRHCWFPGRWQHSRPASTRVNRWRR